MNDFNTLVWVSSNDELKSSVLGLQIAKSIFASLRVTSDIHVHRELLNHIVAIHSNKVEATMAANGFLAMINFALHEYANLTTNTRDQLEYEIKSV